MKRTNLIPIILVPLFFWIAAQSPFHQPEDHQDKVSLVQTPHYSIASQKATQTNNIARFLAGDFHETLQLKASDSLRLISILEDPKGGKHALTQQLHNGIPVFGAWYRLHEKEGILISSRGHLERNLQISTDPILSKGNALKKALAALPADIYAWEDEHFEAALQQQEKDKKATFRPKGELTLVPLNIQQHFTSQSSAGQTQIEENEYHLAWVFDVFAIEPVLKREQIFISAINGKVLHRISKLAHCHVPATGKAAYTSGLVDIATDSCNSTEGTSYQLHDVLRDIEIFDAKKTNGTPAIGFQNNTREWIPPQADTVAIAAMYGLTLWYDYLLDNFGWYGVDGQAGRPIQAWVHYRNNFENAVYSGFLLFGDGNPAGRWKKPMVARDVVAHEASHGLIEHMAGLLYVYESGIINEALADIFACLVELEQEDGNWVLGEAILPGGNRRLDTPNLASLPDTYQGDFWVTQSFPDQALHHNSSVFGHWFYLLSEGGAGVNDLDTSYSVAAMGRKKAADLLFHTLRYYLNPNDGFYDTRRATLDAASGLNWSQEEIDNLAKSWCAIGVGGCNAQGNESVTLLLPNGGEVYDINEPILVEWENTEGVTALRISISVNDGASWNELTTIPIIETTGSQLVDVPNINSRLCRMRVSAVNDPLAFDESDSTFTIIGCELLSAFTVTPESGCFGTTFTVDNTSFEQSANFSWEVDGLPYPGSSSGFTLQALAPGPHIIKLIAQNGACLDSFSHTIQVAPLPSAAFNWSISNKLVTAAAIFPNGEQYFWSVDGQAQIDFNNSQSLIWTAPNTGTFEVCLYIGDNCSPSGETTCQTLSITASENCVGTSASWAQYNNQSEIIDMAEYGDTIIMCTTGGLVYFDKNNQEVVNVLNTANSDLPCQDLGSIAIDHANKWAYVALEPDQGFIRVDLTNNSITHFTTWTLPELLSNKINVLRVDKRGNLWVGTKDKGVWVGKPGVSFQGIYHNELLQKEIIDIDFSSDSLIWIAMRNSLAKIENDLVTTIYSSTDSPLPAGPSPGLNTIMADEDGVWIGAVNGLHKLDAGSWEAFNFEDYDFSSNYVVDIAKRDNGNIIFGVSINSNFIEYDGSSFNRPNCLYAAGAGSIKRFILDNNQVWIGCENGLYTWNEQDACQNHPTAGLPIDRNAIDEIFIKKGGSIYVLGGRSLIEIDQDIFTTTDIVTYLPVGVGSWGLIKMVEEDNGATWVSLTSINFPLAKISPLTGAWQFFDTSSLPFSKKISDFAFRNNKLYLVNTEGLFIWDQLSNTWTTFNRTNSPVWNYGEVEMEFDPAGNLWLANSSVLLTNSESDRLLKFDGQNWEVLSVGNTSVKSFTFSPDGVLWIASGNFNAPYFTQYIKKYEDGEWLVLNPITNLLNGDNAYPRKLILDPSSESILIGSTVGLYKIDKEGSLLEHFTDCNSGLIDNRINDLEINSLSNELWIATEKGVSRFTPSSEIINPSFGAQGDICVNTNTQFLNTTSGANSWEWRVDSTVVSTDRHLNYTFTDVGEHIVELVAFNVQGCATSISQAVTIHPRANLENLPTQVVECDAFWQICAPDGMAEYRWMQGSILVSNQQCLNVDQNNSGNYELKIVDHCGNSKTKLIAITLSGACVYPGDLNNDRIVDYRDLLWLGYTFGYFGPSRLEQGISWIKYPAQDWNGYLPGGANFKYCDADGSGGIDLSDVEAIIANYLNRHGADPGLPVPEQSPYAFVPILTEVDTTLGGNLIRFSVDIVAESSSGVGIDNFYGAGMRMYFTLPPGVQLMETPEFSFNNSSIGIEGVNAVGIIKPFIDQGFMDVAFTRIDHQSQSGVDVLGRANFIVADDHLPIFDTLQFTLNLVGGTAITNEGNFIPVDGVERTFTFSGGQLTGTGNPDLASEILIYPNPTTGRCRLNLQNSSAREVSIQVLSTHGSEVWATAKTGQTLFYDIDLSDWPSGLYWVVITIDGRRRVRKIIKA